MPNKDPHKRREWAKAYYRDHREIIRERSKIYDQDHPDHKATYRQGHQKAAKESHKAYYLAHREVLRERYRIYSQTHPTIGQARSARREARKRELPATLTGEQWETIQKLYRHKCAYCGSRSHHLTQDHVIPLIAGGGTTPDNIVPACRSCNSRKGAGPPPSLPALRLML